MYNELYAEVDPRRRWWGFAFEAARENTQSFKRKLRETMADKLVDKTGRRKYAIASTLQKSAQIATATDPDEMARQILDVSGRVIAEALERSLRAFHEHFFRAQHGREVDIGMSVFPEMKGKISTAPAARKEAQKLLAGAIQRNATRRGIEIGAARASGAAAAGTSAAASVGASVAVAVGGAVVREALPIAGPAPAPPAPKPKTPGM